MISAHTMYSHVSKLVIPALCPQVVDAACHDPAALILPHIVQSLLRDRLEAKAETHQVRQVSQAVAAIYVYGYISCA